MDDQEEQNDFDEIVVEDAASEPGGCLGFVGVAALTVLMIGVAHLVVLDCLQTTTPMRFLPLQA